MKRILTRFTTGLALLSLAACASQSNDRTAAFTATQARQVAAAQTVLRMYADAIGRGDYVGAASLFARDGKYRDSNQWHVAKGPADVLKMLYRFGPSEQPAERARFQNFANGAVVLHGVNGAGRYQVVVGPAADGTWRINLVDWVTTPVEMFTADQVQSPVASVGTDQQYPH